MTTRRRIFRPIRLGALALAAVTVATLVPGFPASAQGGGGQAPGTPADDKAAQQEAALVKAEDKRVDSVRAVAAVAALQWSYQAKINQLENTLHATNGSGGRNNPLPTNPWKQPFRISTGSSYTLILMKQPNPYTLADLVSLAPQTFVRLPDGTYLLSENIFLDTGAQLNLSNPGGLTIRMASSVNSFVSIVSFGGTLTFAGTEQSPVNVTSWDPRIAAPDTDVTDGRAYIRAIGGTLTLTYTHLSDLGFWSGRTGGLAITGADRPTKGAIANATGATPLPGSLSATVQPAGPLAATGKQYTVPGPSSASAQISHCTITGDAFGIFASSVNGVSITDTTVSQSIADGVVMHRYVNDATIQRVNSSHNGGDGFVLARATQQVALTDTTAEGNGHNGYTLSGQALASGASASGESTANYGSNSVSNSAARNNARYGIEMIGGLNVTIQHNQIEGGDMGIVARKGVDTVTIADNTVSGQRRQGISLRDGVARANVTGNTVRGVDTSIYLRNAVATVSGNQVNGSTNHGIALVGAVDGSVVSGNTIDGIGPSAIDTQRANGHVAVANNDASHWFDTRSFFQKIRHYASPMTLLWASILLLILFFASRRNNRRRRRAAVGRDGILHPYADEAPLPVSIIRHYARPMTLLWASMLLLILFIASRRNNRRRRQAAVGRHVILHPYADKAPLRISIIRENIAPVRGRVALASDHTASIPAIASIPATLGNKKVPTPGGLSRRPGPTRRRRRR